MARMTTAPLPFEPTPPGATPPISFLRGLARIAFTQLAQTQPELRACADGDAWVQRTADILAANIASGRFEAARAFQPAAGDGDASLLSYAGQILAELIREAERIAALQRGESAAWQPVISRLERLAYFWLGPNGREAWAAWEARDAAAQTCADLWAWLQEHPYPFDVPFDRWSATALSRRLSNLARRRAREAQRFAFPLDANDSNETRAELRDPALRDHSFDAWLAQAANREALLQLIGRLAERSALVVRLWYFEQWPADEIAAYLGTSVGNVYVLRFRAIARLRQMATADERLGLGDALSLLADEMRRARPAADAKRPAAASRPKESDGCVSAAGPAGGVL